MKQHPLSNSLRDSFEAAQSQSAAFEARQLPGIDPARSRDALSVDCRGDCLSAQSAHAAVLALRQDGRACLRRKCTACRSDGRWRRRAHRRRSRLAASFVTRIIGVGVRQRCRDRHGVSSTPLVDAVRLLASKTDTRVHGVEQLAGLGATRDFRWKGAGLADAWAALLTESAEQDDLVQAARRATSGSRLRRSQDRRRRSVSTRRRAAHAARVGRMVGDPSGPSSQQQPSGASATQISQPPAASEKTTDDGISN